MNQPEDPPRDGIHWFACRTRARSEKVARKALESREEIDPFLPLVEEVHQWSDRTKTVRVPLLPGYLFARFHVDHRTSVLRAARVIEIVEHGGRPAPISAAEIESVRRMAEGASRARQRPEPADYLRPGERVAVVSGPFSGMRGTLLERRGEVRVAVKIDALRQARSVEVDRASVERVDGGAGPAAGEGRRRKSAG